jgi:hypothetical protein
VWFGLALVTYFVVDSPALPRRIPRMVAAGVAMAMLIVEALHGKTHWSPYYKIELNPIGPKGYVVSVNGVGHQTMVPTETKLAEQPFYLVPYTGVSAQPQHYHNALVIGAGTGTDVAVALREGVDHVDAVEIDPEIMELGVENYPDPVPPLADPRVTRHVNDGRAFLRNSSDPYDLIIFALPDSLTLATTMANVRLESFLFTVEAFRSAYDHLSPNGLLVLYNFYRQPWLVEKIAAMLDRAVGTPPCVVNYLSRNYLAIFMTGPRMAQLTCPASDVDTSSNVAAPGVEAGVTVTGASAAESDVASASDDWPFLYLRAPSIPFIYIGAILLVLVVSFLGVVGLAPKGALGRVEPEFFFLGVAFLLLEAKSVVQFQLLFGVTWLVNSLVFFGILLMVLLANLIVRAVRFERPWLVYGLLLGAVGLQYAVPMQSLLGVSAGLRYFAASGIAFLPVFVANLLFSRAFRDAANPDRAFAWNLIGSMIGGTMEYFSLALGYHNLAILVAVFYALAGAFAIRTSRTRAREVKGGESAKPVESAAA